MKTNLNILSGIIIGSLLTVLIIFLLKPTFLSSNDGQVVDHIGDKDLSSEAYELDPDDEADLCKDACINRAINKLITGTNLSDEHGGTIRQAHAMKVAEKIQSEPEIVEKITATFNSLKNINDRRPIILTFSFLPIEQQEQFISRFINSQNPEHRSQMLDLVYYLQDKSDKSLGTLLHVIKNDSDDKVVLEAIEILFGTYPDHDPQLSRSKLNQILSSNVSDEFRALALVLKARFLEINDETKQDIVTILNSKEERIKETAVRVLDDILNRQTRGEEHTDWQSDRTLRSAVETIANDGEEEILTRMEALGLISRHYTE